MTGPDRWPALPYEDWKATYETLHLWTQVVGKIALARSAPINHSWGVALHLTPRGLATALLPHGPRSFSIEFDFLGHELAIQTSDGARRALPLEPQPVAHFYRATMRTLEEMDLTTKIWPMPVELAAPVRFDLDTAHDAYDRAAVERFWSVLVQVARVFTSTRCGFIGKCSPVHFFWGSFDLAVTRFSGRPAPPRDGPAFMREAYSHEVISHGFWPGSDAVPGPVFYAYAAPEPAGFRSAAVQPLSARYDTSFGEFFLPYEIARTDRDPDGVISRFVESTYEQAAALGRWDRGRLERAS